jgi:hypothetical protein
VKLSQFFATVTPYLEGRVGHDETVKALYGKPQGRTAVDAKRLAIYQRFARIHRFEVVESVYLNLRDLARERQGDEAWEALVETYFQRYPMKHFELNANGAAFPEFVAAYAKEQGLPAWYAELADFEWWEWQAIIAPDDDGTQSGPRLSPTVELRPYAYDFVEWLAADPSERAHEPEAADNLVIFWRDREHTLRREKASQLELAVLKAVAGQLTLGDLAAGTGLPLAELQETYRDLADADILLGVE